MNDLAGSFPKIAMARASALEAIAFARAHHDRLGIVSNDGETLKSVTLVAMDGESFKEVKQVEFSFADATPAPVPEPAALIPLSAGLLGLGMVRWNRRRI